MTMAAVYLVGFSLAHLEPVSQKKRETAIILLLLQRDFCWCSLWCKQSALLEHTQTDVYAGEAALLWLPWECLCSSLSGVA